MPQIALLPPGPFGFDGALPPLGTAHRASISRGLSFVLLLAVCCLIVVYAPLAWSDSGHAGRNRPVHALHSANGAGLRAARVQR